MLSPLQQQVISSAHFHTLLESFWSILKTLSPTSFRGDSTSPCLQMIPSWFIWRKSRFSKNMPLLCKSFFSRFLYIFLQLYNLTNVDLAEIARNSVLQSGFEDILKKHWIGDFYSENALKANGIFPLFPSISFLRSSKNQSPQYSLHLPSRNSQKGNRVYSNPGRRIIFSSFLSFLAFSNF